MTDPIKIMKGVLQGESASPSIFNLFLEDVVNQLEAAKVSGIRLHLKVIHILLYADDMCIVSPSAETLQIKIQVVAKFLKSRGLNVNFGKTKVIVFRRAGPICKSDKFSWNGSTIDVVNSYTYLGVTFHYTGTFNLASTDFVRRGLAAQGAALSASKKLRQFNLEVPVKLFNSIVKSTTLYGAGIWGLLQGNPVERVQQQYFKRLLQLPTCTPGYFIRLETGQPHISLEIAKLAMNMFERILKSPLDSLLYNSYFALRRVSSLYPDTKYSWCLQMSELLSSVGYENVWNKNSANFFCSFRASAIFKHRQNLRAADLRLARNSSTVPHYFRIVNCGGAERYLRRNLPTYIVTCISQFRLNYSSIFNRGKWINLGMFEEKLCTLCGERASLSHLFECDQLSQLRSNLLPSNLSNFDNIIDTVHKDINLDVIKRIYIYLTTVLINR